MSDEHDFGEESAIGQGESIEENPYSNLRSEEERADTLDDSQACCYRRRRCCRTSYQQSLLLHLQ